MVIGAATEVIAGEGRIVTAGGIDSHIHFICPQLVDEALSAGLTTLIGGGTGPATGTAPPRARRAPGTSTACWRPPRRFPINLGFLGKGNASRPIRCASRSRRAPSGSSSTRTGARRRPPSTARSSVAEEIRRPGGHPHRHAERGGLRRGLDPRVQGPDDPHLPHRGRGRRPRARHHPRVRRAELPAVVHQPDDAVHREHDGRAPRHADGLPPPERRRSPRTWPSPSRASAPRRSPPRTCCTTSAPSA